MAGEDILQAVFPYLDGPDLAKCMLVCKKWQEIAEDDRLWKPLCLRAWPSICARHSQNNLTFRQLFRKCRQSSHVKKTPLLPPRLSFDDLEFYIDIRKEPKARDPAPKTAPEPVFSEVIAGATLLKGIPNPPPGVCFATKAHLVGPKFKMAVPVEPRFTATAADGLVVSVLVMRKDSDKLASLIGCGDLLYLDATECRVLAFDYIRFSPSYPFVPHVDAWISMLYLHNGFLDMVGYEDRTNDQQEFEVFGVELDFHNCNFVNSEDEVLWLLDMLDWKQLCTENENK